MMKFNDAWYLFKGKILARLIFWSWRIVRTDERYITALTNWVEALAAARAEADG